MNPNQMMNPMAMLQNLNSNTLFQQAQRMAQGKSEAEIIQIARNICREKGINFDEAYSIFQSQYNQKGM